MSYICPNCNTKNYSAFCYKCGHQTIKEEDENYHANARAEQNEAITPQKEIEKLNHIIDDLREKGKKAVASRDNWKRKAERAEKRIEKLEKGFTYNDSKFKKVKTKFALMYHPDKCIGDPYGKLVKQELFKEFWEIIEKIEKE